jgi:hypothetical protein
VISNTGIDPNGNNVCRSNRHPQCINDRASKSARGSILRPKDASNQKQSEQTGNAETEESVLPATGHGNPPASKTSEREDRWGDLSGCNMSPSREM